MFYFYKSLKNFEFYCLCDCLLILKIIKESIISTLKIQTMILIFYMPKYKFYKTFGKLNKTKTKGFQNVYFYKIYLLFRKKKNMAI